MLTPAEIGSKRQSREFDRRRALARRRRAAGSKEVHRERLMWAANQTREQKEQQKEIELKAAAAAPVKAKAQTAVAEKVQPFGARLLRALTRGRGAR